MVVVRRTVVWGDTCCVAAVIRSSLDHIGNLDLV